MKTITTSKGKFLFVEVMPDSEHFSIIHNGTRLAHFQPTYRRIDLPKGNYEIICTTQTITEEQAKEIVGETVEFGFYASSVIWLDSLMKAHDLTAPKYAILKIIETLKPQTNEPNNK